MKRFNFSLQKVLDMREFEKKQAQTELGKALSVETNIQNTLDMIAESRVKTVHEADSMHDISSLYNANLYFRLLDKRRDMATEELAKAKIITNEKREVMIDAMKKVKVLETLRNHRKDAWRKEQLKIEDDQVDEIVTSRFNFSDSVSDSK